MVHILLIVLFFIVGCGKSPTGTGPGFENSITVELTMDGDNITDIVLVEEKEAACLIDRAFPVLKERIIMANSPVVDSVSGATFTSFGVKYAVSEALKAVGKEAPKITVQTKGPEKPEMTIADVTTDLLIVGGGPAGLSAALTAYENGISNIILIEKLDILSGNGKFDQNFYDLVNSEGQKKAGINDSADLFYEDMIKRYKGDDTNRLRVLADYSATTDAWLRTHNVQLDYVVARDHQVSEEVYAGDYLQRGLEQSLSNTTVEIRTGTKGLDLIINKNTIKGVRVKNNNNENYSIYAKSVIIATGGFVANNEMVARQNKDYAQFVHSNQEKNLGDFIPIFQKHNIAIDNLDVFNIFPYTVVKNRALTGSGESDVDFILVNKMGTRFIAERGLSRPEFAEIMLQQPDQMAYYVFDDLSRAAGPRIRVHIRKGYGMQGDTLEDLAKKMKVDATIFVKTIEDYNEVIIGEEEDPYGRPVYKREFASKGPFFAIAVRPALHMTRGGVVANEKAEVQGVNRQSIKGLYAAGEVTSMIDGAYMAAVAFGRVAGDRSSEFIKQ